MSSPILHPSIFLRRKTEEEYADTFGGIAAPQDVLAAYEGGNESKRAQAEAVIRAMYAPVIDLHWVTVKQLAQCEPTLVETVACMIGDFLKESLHEAVHTMGIPEPAARSILLGHVQVALANALQGDNPFSDACMIAMDYGRSKIIKDDWKVIFRDDELDKTFRRCCTSRSRSLAELPSPPSRLPAGGCRTCRCNGLIPPGPPGDGAGTVVAVHDVSTISPLVTALASR